MNADDSLPFSRHLGVLAETFGETLTSVRINGYFRALEDLPLGAVQHAIESALRACRFFPKPAELRELAGDVAPDAGLIEACLVAHLRECGGERMLPADPFLRLVIERLGGLWQAGEMTSFERLQALRGIVPPLVSVARARGIALPTCTTPEALTMAARERHVALMAPDTVPHATAVAVLEQVMPAQPTVPVDMATLVTNALRGLEAHSAEHLADEQKRKQQKPVDIEARKAELREQARTLLEKGKA